MDHQTEKGSGAGIILENEEGVTVEYSLRFNCPTSNNQAKYEACLVGIIMAKEMGAAEITLCLVSKLVVSQIKGEYQAREAHLQKYLQKVRESLIGLSCFKIKHIPREENSCANLLSKLASTKKGSQHHSIIEETIPRPVVILQAEEEDWRTPILQYVIHGRLPNDPVEASSDLVRTTRELIQKRGIASAPKMCGTKGGGVCFD
jgi:ribonuclease HI